MTIHTLDGRTALVTGGARGIGAAIVRRLHAEGANVVITDLLNAEGEALAAGLGQRALFVHHDVADEAGWQAAVAAAVERFGALHVLVNNAGVYQPGAVEDTSTATFEWMVRVNQTGTFLGMKHALEPMKAAGGGSIVNISSIAGMVGFPGACAYVGTKWAVRGMTKTVAVEFARHRIRVNSVHPGFIDTPMLAGNSDEANAAGIAATPLKRVGQPDDIAAAVAYLAGDGASFVTGTELVVDGGYVL
ncbi:SDR family NAD(P)-dependent oxidoreductase [Luteimonas sp. MHLX1A]|uniref:SDR family NAD(P)-dependent oxidoreductase n=1 Tax=Alterluteimonas muca TaxID=2878684 RepID=UPI001E2C96CB|nr:glucose 1-dehydrogenase [Luteimonas sp. MHLX1A]MCD9047183.1 glucose 1-dehydrogenase [Luteimonas sp. MHLX1A]